jgi:hypothetical protein
MGLGRGHSLISWHESCNCARAGGVGTIVGCPDVDAILGFSVRDSSPSDDRNGLVGGDILVDTETLLVLLGALELLDPFLYNMSTAL